MKSRRTISYIGLWALIMPWLGFSWETKTVLFSLTGIVLLFIGNRYYHAEKKIKLDSIKKEESEAAKKEEPVIIAQSIKTYDDVPNYMEQAKQTSYHKEPESNFSDSKPNSFNQNFEELKQASNSSSQEEAKEIILETKKEISFEKPEPQIEYADQNIATGEPVIKPKQQRVRKSIEILPRLRRDKKAIPLESLDNNEENNNEI